MSRKRKARSGTTRPADYQRALKEADQVLQENGAEVRGDGGWNLVGARREMEGAMVTMEMLAGIPLFKGLTEEMLAAIAALCRRESFPAGVAICSPGRSADRLYFLLEGRVGLLVHPTSLPEPMTIMVLSSPGQPFGWSALLGGRSRSSPGFLCESPT